MNLRTFFRTFFAATTLVLACSALKADPGDDLIKNGDACAVKLESADALKFYLPAEKLQPNNATLLVSISRQYRHEAIDRASRDEKVRLIDTALNYAQRAARMAPNDSEAQIAVAICYGRLLPLEGTKQQLEASSLIKAAADKAIKLDPRNDVAWHVLGRWNEALADVSGVKRALGSLVYGKIPTTTHEAAVRCFERAIEINPRRLKHYVELGRTYAQMGRTADARRCIQKGLSMPDAEKDDPEIKVLGRETLAKLQ